MKTAKMTFGKLIEFGALAAVIATLTVACAKGNEKAAIHKRGVTPETLQALAKAKTGGNYDYTNPENAKFAERLEGASIIVERVTDTAKNQSGVNVRVKFLINDEEEIVGIKEQLGAKTETLTLAPGTPDIFVIQAACFTPECNKIMTLLSEKITDPTGKPTNAVRSLQVIFENEKVVEKDEKTGKDNKVSVPDGSYKILWASSGNPNDLKTFVKTSVESALQVRASKGIITSRARKAAEEAAKKAKADDEAAKAAAAAEAAKTGKTEQAGKTGEGEAPKADAAPAADAPKAGEPAPAAGAPKANDPAPAASGADAMVI